MNILKIIKHCARTALLITVTLSAPALAGSSDIQTRRDQGSAVIKKLNRGNEQAVLETMRKEFPFLADATEAYALGDVWSRNILDDRTRQLAAVAALAATGETAMMGVHASYALNIGVTAEDLKEVIYLVTVTSGFPRAIAASQTLSAVIAQHVVTASGKAP